MSKNDEFLKMRQKQIKDPKPKITKDTKVELSLAIVNEMLSNQERLTVTVSKLNDEIKKLLEQGGQKTLD